MESNKTFGDILYTLRTERGITQIQLANKIGVSRHSIGNYEQNRREPNIETLTKLANVLNVTLDRLIRFSDGGEIFKTLDPQSQYIMNTISDLPSVTKARLIGYIDRELKK